MKLSFRFFSALVLVIFYFASARAETGVKDVVMIGGGIMSGTLATLIHELDPDLKIEIYERLDHCAGESSDTFNNAGSGHAALCELNYTPELEDGTIDVRKAVQINEEFEVSKQFWSYLVAHENLGPLPQFIHTVPHLTWVHGEKNVQFLRKRFETLRKISLFEDMEFTDDPAVLKQWMPLVMENRAPGEPMAATRSFLGTDVDYGHLTRLLFDNLKKNSSVRVSTSQEVRSLHQDGNGIWHLSLYNLVDGTTQSVSAKSVFIGAGGGTLPLFQKSGAKEALGYGGFPVDGEFLVYKGTQLSELNFGKIYGQAATGAPPMSVPHLDTRIIDGQKRLIFGPFAGATTKFLKEGSILDLPGSIRPDNIQAMMQAGVQNLGLLKYLASQQMQSFEDRMNALREFVPNAKSDEWEIVTAGKRVQIVKRGKGPSVLQLGTEVVSTADGSLAALLGASPGASTSVTAMLEVLKREFGPRLMSEDWQWKLHAMIPSYGHRLVENRELLTSVRENSKRVLKLSDRESCERALTAKGK